MIGSGTYNKDDVTFLLKDLGGMNLEMDNESRERLKAEGVHYSKMLPVEKLPTERYMSIFEDSLVRNGEILAGYVKCISDKVIDIKGENVVLVSLARAGTPIGVLMRRYLRDVRKIDVPHYSVSIIRGVGLDLNAIKFIVDKHPGFRIQFVDGWTGKGAITRVLNESCVQLRADFGIDVDDRLAVIADPGGCAHIYATRDDWLLPNACLNSTVSGLVSRTVFDEDIIGEREFHGAKFYEKFILEDRSLYFVDYVSGLFKNVGELRDDDCLDVDWRGIKFVEKVALELGISDLNLIKPSVGETTRVLLRRVPRVIFVKSLNDPDVRHILELAQDVGVEVVARAEMPYLCCGVIREVDGDTTK